jgi:hypothetical protein
MSVCTFNHDVVDDEVVASDGNSRIPLIGFRMRPGFQDSRTITRFVYE